MADDQIQRGLIGVSGKRILVTGATGNVGREVVKELLRLQQPVVAATLNHADARKVPGKDTPTVELDFTKPATYDAAFQDVDRLLLMRPPHITNTERDMNPLLDFAVRAGVKHVAFVSLLGVKDNPSVPHYQVEQHLLSCGVPYTFLRPSFFMQNLNTTHRDEIRDRDEIYVPVGNARTSFIDVRDIGVVAATVLISEGHAGKAYDLTGAEALDYYQVADLFTEILGRKITYRNPSNLRFVLGSLRHGRELGFTLVMSMLYRATRDGVADRVSDDVSQLLGRRPITLRRYIEDYSDSWL